MFDTVDLRSGPPLHDRLLALLPLVGQWQGGGSGVVARTGEHFRYAQQLTFAHDGRPFLVYDAQAWLLDQDGTVLRAAWRERGFWRPGAGADDLEVTLADAAGLVEVLEGTAGDQRWELATTSLGRASTAKDVRAERRLYAVTGDALVYATELQYADDAMAPHLNASLTRLASPGGDAEQR